MKLDKAGPTCLALLAAALTSYYYLLAAGQDLRSAPLQAGEPQPEAPATEAPTTTPCTSTSTSSSTSTSTSTTSTSASATAEQTEPAAAGNELEPPWAPLPAEDLSKHRPTDDAGAELETRKAAALTSPPASARDEPALVPAGWPPALFNGRRFVRLRNKVFTYAELPALYRSPVGGARARAGGGGGGGGGASGGGGGGGVGGGGGGPQFCADHLGCLEEIPNYSSLLRRSNVSSSFTVYTRAWGQAAPGPDVSLASQRLAYKPLWHVQLSPEPPGSNASQLAQLDRFASLLELQQANSKLKPLSLLQTASPAGLVSSPAHGSLATSGGALLSAAAGAALTIAAGATSGHQLRGRQHVRRALELPFDLAGLERSRFNASLNTRVIVGGYFAKEGEKWIDELVRHWLALEPCNVIKVSWPDSNRGLYHTAAHNSRIVGRQLTLLIHYLDQLFGLDLSRVHLVGHSLGAHIAGAVGADLNGRLARITGLDPAGPIFVDLNTSMRLDPSDAQFVDVLHTNGGSLTRGALGLSTPSGHVDYYPNGGSSQPGCYFSSVTKSIVDPVERIACNHRRSYRYFIELIKLAGSQMQLQQPTSQRRSGPNEAAQLLMPGSFLFEAKPEELTRLVQPELALTSRAAGSAAARRRQSPAGSAPLRRTIEFHLMQPQLVDQPEVGELDSETLARQAQPQQPQQPPPHGLYYVRTRAEPPYFAPRQYALSLFSVPALQRKIALSVRLDHEQVAELELDELPRAYTIVIAPGEPGPLETSLASSRARPPSLHISWRSRSFNLLKQSQELQLTAVQLSALDPWPASGSAGAGADLEAAGAPEPGSELDLASIMASELEAPDQARSAAGSAPPWHRCLVYGAPPGQPLSLARNLWHRLEGSLANSSAQCD